MMARIPLVDLAEFDRPRRRRDDAVRALDDACRDRGFFCVVGHGIAPELLARLDTEARAFFARPAEEKAEIAMARGGRAWRGWFPPGGELTSGVPDGKEGIYFGEELAHDDPRVRAGVPLHGPNLFPVHPAGLRATVLDVMDQLTALGQRVMRALALALGLDNDFFSRELTADPTTLFRVFHYPPVGTVEAAHWGVAEHTDYGLLTLLVQDDTGGLEVRGPNGWAPVEPTPGMFVCNLGDMLERMTAGRYRSTPHRVRPPIDRDRISSPFFFDPGWDVEVAPLPLGPTARDLETHPRWDHTNPHEWSGTYGEYLLAKVSKVFPGLGDAVAEP
ncbi:MAG TPA: 2-oxoglutarate and iron-dependent oxygenase domain-containing protein [Acidimicrobiia bacterium]|nr:2-oxoglutarate and iron-dependent oxygenase domain-containing protein [Acidimicrobiia bacterium]